MSRANRTRRKRARARKAQIAARANRRRTRGGRWKTPKFWRGASFAWKAVGAVALALGVLSAILSFLPRLSVSPLAAMHEPNPFSTLFAVSNDGPVALNDVECSCKIANLQTTRPDIFIAGNEVADPVVKVLEPNEKTTTRCKPLSVGAPGMFVVPQGADVLIIVSYGPSFVPWRMSKNFRFMSAYDSNGKIQWFPMANDKK